MVRIEGTVRDWASCAQLSTGSCRPRQVRAPTPQITETLEGSQIFRTPRRVSSRRSSCGPPSTAASQQNTRKNSNNLIIIYNLGSSICLLFFLRLATVSLFFVSSDQPCLPSQSPPPSQRRRDVGWTPLPNEPKPRNLVTRCLLLMVLPESARSKSECSLDSLTV